MSNYDPFNGKPAPQPYGRTNPLASYRKSSCPENDFAHQAVRIVNKLREDLTNPLVGASLVGYLESLSVRGALDDIYRRFENEGDALDNKVDKIPGWGLSEENFSLIEKNKLASLENYDDSSILQALDTKVDKVVGKGLSTNDLTDPLYEKLVGLEGTHWRGTFVSVAALEAGVTDPQAGDYADVDVAGEDVQRYIWDATDSAWVAKSGEVAPITAVQVKQLYESNPDTNAFTDADVMTLAGIQPQIDDINLLIGDIGAVLDVINGEIV